MELRVHGIGGTTAASMLGHDATAALVPRWPRGAGARPHVWQGDDPAVSAYHWARLTSGSKWFVLWPLLLPFTLLNVAGFMYPAGRLGRLLRWIHGLLCVAATVWFAGWLVYGGQVVALTKGWSPEVGVGLAAVGAGLVVGPSAVRCRWPAGVARRAPGQPRGGFGDPGFFRTGRLLWVGHLLALLATAGGIWWYEHSRPAEDLRSAAATVVVDAGAVLIALLWVLVVGTVAIRVVSPRVDGEPLAWTFRAAGVTAFGAAMIGGLLIALLRVVVPEAQLRGAPYALFDVYGWAVLAALAAGVAAAIVLLVRKSPGERVPLLASRLLPHPGSWFRARVALLPRAGALALGAAALTFLVLGTLTFLDRAPASVADWQERLGVGTGSTAAERLEEASYTPASSAVVRIAQLTIYGLFAVMFLNLVRSWGSTRALRRVGTVWDVLTFWPRQFHPFAVRPYTECAVDQLRELLFTEVDDDWTEPLTVLAHSQGSMIVMAALAPGLAPGAAAPGPCRVAHLVTAGSPLRAIYMKAFPAYCDEAVLAQVSAALGPEHRWTNVFRFTDHVGRTVFGEELGWEPNRRPEPGQPQDRWWHTATDSSGAEHVDCALADPDANQAAILGAGGYWADRRVREVVG